MCASLAHAPGHIYKCIYISEYILLFPCGAVVMMNVQR